MAEDRTSNDEKLEIIKLEKLLASRTNPGGSARAGFKHNVSYIQGLLGQLYKKRGDSFVAFSQ
jgi:hypothetical protein